MASIRLRQKVHKRFAEVVFGFGAADLALFGANFNQVRLLCKAAGSELAENMGENVNTCDGVKSILAGSASAVFQAADTKSGVRVCIKGQREQTPRAFLVETACWVLTLGEEEA